MPGDRIVIGAGCYGSYHARQLDRARGRGRLDADNLVLVDRNPASRAATEFAGRPGFRFETADWLDWLDAYLDAAPPDSADWLVPTPLGPHLMFEWLKRRAVRAVSTDRVRPIRPAALPGTPYAESSPDGTGYLSFATWTCPVTCIEPAICPATRGPKAWEMDEAVFAWARRSAAAGSPLDDVRVFRCRHHAYGVSAWPVAECVSAREGLARLIAAVERAPHRPRRLAVATTSSCHGVLDLLEIAPAPASST
jgi:hypothetical protein